jgi:hypothetical protein
MVGDWFDCGRSFCTGNGSRGRAFVRRKDSEIFRDSDPGSEQAAAEDQEEQPDAVAKPNRFPEIDNPPQTQIISHAHPRRGRNTQNKAEKIFSCIFAQSVSVFDFKTARAKAASTSGTHPRFVGYGKIPGLGGEKP